ncbi:MAG TPA: hypothetical protein VF120_16085, partial [Ktedonobacterales bacterium]
MSDHVEAGALRAYLDEELSGDERDAMTARLAEDVPLADRAAELRALDERVSDILRDGGALPD